MLPEMSKASQIFPILHFSLFSGLAACVLFLQDEGNPWMLALSLLGVASSILWVFRPDPAASESEEQKAAIMSDLDEEIERRRKMERAEKN